jgi:hypothetical protein
MRFSSFAHATIVLLFHFFLSAQFCFSAEDDVSDLIRSAPDKKLTYKYSNATIIISGDKEYEMNTGEHGSGFFSCRNISEMEDLAKNSEKLVIELDESSDMNIVSRLMRSYRNTHESDDNLELKLWRPDEKYKDYDYKAKISLNKNRYSDREPVMLTLKIRGENDKWSVAWQLFTPCSLRIRDEKGGDIDFLAYPVSGLDDAIRSKIWAGMEENSFDLSSFIDPYYGVEHIYKFSPGKYTVTYYFYSPYRPIGVGKRHYADAECRWGQNHSNTVTFEIFEDKNAGKADIKALFRSAYKFIDENKPEDAIGEFKKVVRSTKDFSNVRKAIEHIMIIRRLAYYEPLQFMKNIARKHAFHRYGDDLRKAIEDYEKEVKNSLNRCFEANSLGLSLLHIRTEESREIIERFIKCRDSFWTKEGVDEAEEKFFKNFHLEGYIKFPQLRPILEKKIADPEKCSKELLELYLETSERDFPKSPQTMKAFLQKYPLPVLEYYAENKSPRELVPFFAQYFDDETNTWGNGEVQAHVSDAAFKAFENAVGLNLGFSKDHDGDYCRISHRNQIRDILKQWWKVHEHEYGLTTSAGK